MDTWLGFEVVNRLYGIRTEFFGGSWCTFPMKHLGMCYMIHVYDPKKTQCFGEKHIIDCYILNMDDGDFNTCIYMYIVVS